MRIRAISLIAALVLLFSAFTTISFAEMDYKTTYDTAIDLASNDLSNVKNLNDASTMLQQIGTYGYSLSYLIYFQQIAAIQSTDPDIDSIILTLDVCKDMTEFNKDLEARNLPSCTDLIAYAKARAEERDGNLNEAC